MDKRFSDLGDSQVSVYKGVRDRQGIIVPIQTCFDWIQTGNTSHPKLVAYFGEATDLKKATHILNIVAETDPEAYNREKTKLPAVTWSGTFKNRKHLIQHSGFIVLDFDGIDTASLKAEMNQNPNVRLAFTSPSGKGLKVIVPVHPTPKNAREHKYAYAAVRSVFEVYGEIDTSGSDVNRLCFQASDPQTPEDEEPECVDWDIDEAEEQEQQSRESETPPTGKTYGDVSIEQATHVLSFVPRDLSYSEWRNVGMGIKQAGLPVSVFQAWSKGQRLNSKGVWVDENCLSHWNRYNSHGITWGSVVHIAKQNGYVPPIHRKPVKLQNVKPYEKVIETIDTARDFLKNVFEKGSDFFAIRTDTGTGKTENAITYAITKDVAIPTQSGKLRDEIVSRAIDKEMFAWGYRGINETEEADGYMPCIQPERFDLFRQKGFNPYKWICESCPAYHECKERGYLSQPHRAKASQLLAIPFPTAFLDGRLRNWAKMYLPREGMILHDDLPIGSLFIEYQLTADRLRRIMKDWHGTVAAEWAEIVLNCFSTRDWAKMRSANAILSDKDFYKVVQAFTRCILPETGAIVEADTLIRSQLVDFSTTDAIAALPTIDPEKFDTPTILELFWQRYPRLDDAPFFYTPATETFTLTFLPKPYRSDKVRVGFASATMHKDLIKRIFPDIEFYDANTTAWEKGAHLYQLRTNRNPRATVLNAIEKYNATGEKVWEWDGLSETGADFYAKVLSFIKNNPNETHAVLSYKSVIEEKQHELDALGVRTAHFGNLAGLDDAFEGVKNFHILFCPFVKPSDVDFLCKQLFGNDETPLIRDADGNLERNADGTYTDNRAQQVNDALVTGELLQAIGRARLNLYPNRVFLWTSLFIDAVTNRTETTLFDEVDWETADAEISKLKEVVKMREDGNAKELAQRTGQSERTARRQTQGTRKQSKAELQQEALRLYTQGQSYREIGKALDKAPNTIKNWCQTAHF